MYMLIWTNIDFKLKITDSKTAIQREKLSGVHVYWCNVSSLMLSTPTLPDLQGFQALASTLRAGLGPSLCVCVAK